MLGVHERPIIGNWYLDLEHSDQFEIVATDEQDKAIEIQYFGGEIEEIDYDTWYKMKVMAIAAPKDWSGPFEFDKELFTDLKDESLHPFDGARPLDELE